MRRYTTAMYRYFSTFITENLKRVWAFDPDPRLMVCSIRTVYSNTNGCVPFRDRRRRRRPDDSRRTRPARNRISELPDTTGSLVRTRFAPDRGAVAGGRVLLFGSLTVRVVFKTALRSVVLTVHVTTVDGLLSESAHSDYRGSRRKSESPKPMTRNGRTLETRKKNLQQTRYY